MLRKRKIPSIYLFLMRSNNGPHFNAWRSRTQNALWGLGCPHLVVVKRRKPFYRTAQWHGQRNFGQVVSLADSHGRL
jgi:hypothetical protein